MPGKEIFRPDQVLYEQRRIKTVLLSEGPLDDYIEVTDSSLEN